MSEAALRRPLRLRDLVLAQVLVVVGTNWFGVAAQLGGAGLVAWIAALALFHLPLAWVVIALTRACPREGGLYAWTSQALGPGAAFLAGWTFWLFILVFTAAGALGMVTSFAYALGPGGAAALEDRRLLALGVAVVLGIVLVAALRGLGEARWFQDAASLGFLLVIALLAGRVGMALLRGEGQALEPALPPLDAPTLALFSRLAVYGLAGLECLSILAGEVQDPARTLPRSVALAAPLNGLVYLIGTAAVLVTVRTGEIDLVNPVAQLFAAQGGALASAVILLLLLRDLGQSSTAFAANARLPLVAGWDGLLPGVLTRLDRRGTPRNAALLCGAVALILGLGAVLDSGRQVAFQLLLSAAGLLFGGTYVLLFLLPLVAARKLGLPATPGLRLVAVVGLGMTLLFLAFSVYPIVDVPDPGLFALKALATVAVLEGLGIGLLLRYRRVSLPTKSRG